MLKKVQLIIGGLVLLLMLMFVKSEKLLDFITVRRDITPTPITLVSSNITTTVPTFKPKLSIIILNLGDSKMLIANAANLSGKASLGISAYVEDLKEVMKTILLDKHDTMLLMPSQPIDYDRNDPGPDAITVDEDMSKNATKLHNLFLRLPSPEVGIYLCPSSIFPINQQGAENIVTMLENNTHKFKFFAYYDQTATSYLTQSLAISKISTKVLRINVIIDSIFSAEDITNNLDNIMKLSSINGKIYVIGIVANQLSINTLSSWVDANKSEIQFLSVTDILNIRK